MKTIIQKIGPLYGEAVNGTVFGQPNGSQAVLPLSFVETPNSTYYYVKEDGGLAIKYGRSCDSNGTIGPLGKFVYTAPVPVSFVLRLYSDSACTTAVSVGYYVSGQYAGTVEPTHYGMTLATLTQGTTYYARAYLLYDGQYIAESAIYPVEAV